MYASSSAESSQHQFIVVISGAFSFISVILHIFYQLAKFEVSSYKECSRYLDRKFWMAKLA